MFVASKKYMPFKHRVVACTIFCDFLKLNVINWKCWWKISRQRQIFFDLKTFNAVYPSLAEDLLECLNYSLETGEIPDLLKIGHSSPLLKIASLKGVEFSHFREITMVSIVSQNRETCSLSFDKLSPW